MMRVESQDCLYTVVRSSYISNIFKLMKVFEQQCIINLALKKNTRQGKKRIELAETLKFSMKKHAKTMILVIFLSIAY